MAEGFDKDELVQRFYAVRNALPPHVTLIAVSKTRPIEQIQALYDLGHRAFGENYPQELRDKYPLLPADIEWHFIGHLQTNKVKYIAPFVHLVHGVDSVKLLHELNKRAAAEQRIQDVLLQVHIAVEETKHGLGPKELEQILVAPLNGMEHVRIRGLMGMASNTADRPKVQAEFEGLATLFEQMKRSPSVDPALFTQLSMGMSGDVEPAIAAGSTMVRIGSAIFGERG